MSENTENGLPENFVENNLKEICHLIAKNSDEDFLYNFFDCLFTQNEMTDFAKRWQLVKELDSGVTQREIAKKYNMSLCKITRGSKMLKSNDSAFRILLDMLASEK
ncbi:MAG: trp operon repressor [Treponema sp.]|nr:trp operon repressor [Treponema sp.]